MTRLSEPSRATSSIPDTLYDAIAAHPRSKTAVGVTRCPAVVDVMGGIAEESGALVVTAALHHSYHAAVWETTVPGVKIALHDGAASPQTFRLEPASLERSTLPSGLIQACNKAGAEWAVPACLAIREAIHAGIIGPLEGGLIVWLETDFPPEADLGRPWVLATAVIDALCRMADAEIDQRNRAEHAARAVQQTNGLYNRRMPLTALCGPKQGGLLQMRFLPNYLCEPLPLPDGVTVYAARTYLTRPTRLDRLVDTSRCADLGRRLIAELQRQDGAPIDPAKLCLARVTPTEFVERYRDRLPQKIKGAQFAATFSELRGLDGTLDPNGIYKIRSRAEHHIYENRRVHEFATRLVRAKRMVDAKCLAEAGELMYASHWSHSQRCGIGGVEADDLSKEVRQLGPTHGLYGAKTTAGGEGGEVVVLLRDDPNAFAALDQAVAAAQPKKGPEIRLFKGSLPGADYFAAPAIA